MSSKEDKLKELDINSLADLSDEDVNLLYKHKKKKPKIVVPKPVKVIDTTTDRYKTLLKLINKFLIKMKKPKIKTLQEFQNIKRTDIIAVDRKVIKDMEGEIFGVLGCKPHVFYRSSSKGWNLNVLRYLVKDVGLKIVYKKKNVYTNENNKTIVCSEYIYSIKNI